MTLKEKILNKIKSISDLNLLRELDAWISQIEERKHEQVNETDETYHTESTVKNRGKTGRKLKSGVDYLEKIAEKGGVKGIDDPVEWQRKERQDRTLTFS